MFDRVRQSVRRARQSSSDSEPGTPVKLQRTMADGNSDQTGDKTIEDVYTYLVKMENTNQETRRIMENRLDKFEVDMKSYLNSTITSLRADMSTEFNRVDAQIQGVHEKIQSMESQINPLITDMNPRSEFDTVRNICIKNINETDEGDSVDNLKNSVAQIFTALSVDVNMVCARRVGKRGDQVNDDQTRPRPAIITLESTAQRNTVLKAKASLRLTDEYKRIYIETDKTRHERISEANMRTIAKKIGLTVRGGRIIKPQQ